MANEVPVGAFKSITVYPPGQQPYKIPGERILAAGCDPVNTQGHVVVIESGENGERIEWWDVPCKIHRQVPSGLVAPGGPIIARG